METTLFTERGRRLSVERETTLCGEGDDSPYLIADSTLAQSVFI